MGYWPANTKSFRTIAVVCLVINQPYRAQHLLVPDGLLLLVKSYSGNAPAALCRIATNSFECTTINASYTLVVGEAVAFQIQDAYECFVSSTVAGSIVTFTAEQEG
jgi:hypothetical protein